MESCFNTLDWASSRRSCYTDGRAHKYREEEVDLHVAVQAAGGAERGTGSVHHEDQMLKATLTHLGLSSMPHRASQAILVLLVHALHSVVFTASKD